MAAVELSMGKLGSSEPRHIPLPLNLHHPPRWRRHRHCLILSTDSSSRAPDFLSESSLNVVHHQHLRPLPGAGRRPRCRVLHKSGEEPRAEGPSAGGRERNVRSSETVRACASGPARLIESTGWCLQHREVRVRAALLLAQCRLWHYQGHARAGRCPLHISGARIPGRRMPEDTQVDSAAASSPS